MGLVRTISTVCLLSGAWLAAQESAASTFRESVAPLLERYCFECHGELEQEGDVRLDVLRPSIAAGHDLEDWNLVLEQLSLRAMPPDDAEAQPTREERAALVEWITAALREVDAAPDPQRLASPRFGNRVPHEDLFSGPVVEAAWSPARIWRISPHIYDQFGRDRGMYKKLAQPLAPLSDGGFDDYATTSIGGAAIGALLRNSKKVALDMLRGRNDRGSRWREFKAALASEDPGEAQWQAAIGRGFDLLLGREPSDAERERVLELVRQNAALGGTEAALESMLRALMLSTEFLFRMELGLGEELPDGRRMLAPRELAYALSYALTDAPPDRELRKAVAEGRLATREDVEREARRILAAGDNRDYWIYPMYHRWGDAKHDTPRVLRFFREFFGYEKAKAVFKDTERNPSHDPKYLVRDADIFVMHTLEQDERVLETLLTSDRYFVSYMPEEQARQVTARNNKRKEQQREGKIERLEREGKPVDPEDREPVPGYDELLRAGELDNPVGYARSYFVAYNLPGGRRGARNQKEPAWSWVPEQPFALPHRAGMLTHPAWLAAHSGNFDNDPVRRGKWIRERLLADSIPDVPIGVDAKVPDDPHRTLRERFDVVDAQECWRCHRAMNPLGMPFEAYDDFGRFRSVHYFDADGALVEIKRRPPAELAAAVEAGELTTRPVDTSGELRGTRDPALDGPVEDAVDLVHRLARSARVRQSFVRHAFRFWMGRNEALRDKRTLLEADRAYREHGGSFRELLVSLLTSDSFLYRKDVE